MPGLVRVRELTVAPFGEQETERAYAASLRPDQPLADRESSAAGTAVLAPRLLTTAHDHAGGLLHPAGWTRADPNPLESVQHHLRQHLNRHARALARVTAAASCCRTNARSSLWCTCASTTPWAR